MNVRRTRVVGVVNGAAPYSTSNHGDKGHIQRAVDVRVILPYMEPIFLKGLIMCPWIMEKAFGNETALYNCLY